MRREKEIEERKWRYNANSEDQASITWSEVRELSGLELKCRESMW